MFFHFANRSMKLKLVVMFKGIAVCTNADGAYLVGNVIEDAGNYLLASPNEYASRIEALNFFNEQVA